MLRIDLVTALCVLLTCSLASAQEQNKAFCDEADQDGFISKVENFLNPPPNFWTTYSRPEIGFFNGDDYPDYCRAMIRPGQPLSNKRTGHLACTLGVGKDFGDAYRGKTFCSEEVLIGVGGEWVDFSGDGKLDYCTTTYIPDPDVINRKVALCYISAENSFKSTQQFDVSFGTTLGKRWVDFNADGKTDLCQHYNYVPLNVDTNDPKKWMSGLDCALSDGSKFASVVKRNLNYRVQHKVGMLDWVDINADGKYDFCSVGGEKDSLLLCHLSDGLGLSGVRIENLSVR